MAYTYTTSAFQIPKYRNSLRQLSDWGAGEDFFVIIRMVNREPFPEGVRFLEVTQVPVPFPLNLPEPLVALDPLRNMEITFERDPYPMLNRLRYYIDWDSISRIQRYNGHIEFTDEIHNLIFFDRDHFEEGRDSTSFWVSLPKSGPYTIKLRAENEYYEVTPWFTYSGQIEADMLAGVIRVAASTAGATQDVARVVRRDPEARSKQTVQHNEKVITEQGYGVTTLYGLHTIALKPLDPMDCGAIGNQAVCDMDVLDVADISGHAEQGIRFCFPQLGQILFMPSHDIEGEPIDQKTAEPEVLAVEIVDGQSCVTIYRRGKLVLVESDAPLLQEAETLPAPVYSPTGSGNAVDTNCYLPLLLRPGDIAKADTTVNIRSAPSRSGADLGDLIPNELVSVIEGPVVADNYVWFKVRRVPTARPNEAWVAESGTRDDGCGYFFGKDQSAAFQSFDISDEGKEAIAETVPAFHSDAQLQAAEDAIFDTMIFACDALTSAGTSLGKDGLKKVLKAAIHEAVRKVGLGTADFSADELREARDNGTLLQWLGKIPQFLDRLAVILDAIPTGACSLTETTIYAVTGELLLDWLEAGTPDPVVCEISSEEPVLAYNWPSGEGIVVAKLFAGGGLKPAGFVQLPGQPRFYMIRGAFGFETPILGAALSRLGLLLNPEGSTYGAVFVHVSHAQATEACDDLIDLSELMLHTDRTGEGRGVVDPRIILASRPESRDCQITIFGDYELYDSVGELENPGQSSSSEYSGGFPDEQFKLKDLITKYSILKFANLADGEGSVYVQRVGNPAIRGWVRLSGAIWGRGSVGAYGDVSECNPRLEHLLNLTDE